MEAEQSSKRSFIGLNSANFFQAEMVGVVMPILNAFLKEAGWLRGESIHSPEPEGSRVR